MKLYKLFIAAAIVGGMITSCSEDGVWDQASPASLGLSDGTSYAFNSSSVNYTYYPQDVMADMNIEITVTRANTNGSVTLPISAVFSDETLMSGPESITFADGSNTAVYPIHIDKEFEIGSSATAKLVIDTLSVGIPAVAKPEKLKPGATAEDSAKFLADSTNYALYIKKLSNYKLATTVTIEKDYNWESLGTGQYYDRFTWGAEYYEAEIQQAVENKSWYRVVDPYTQALEDNEVETKDGPSKYVKFRLLQPGDEVRGVTVTQKDLVFFEDFKTGEHPSDYNADIWACHPSGFSSLSDESNWAYSRVNSYQKDGTPAEIRLSAMYYMFGVGGWNYTTAGYISIVFPGVKLYYYNAAIEYAGLFTNAAGVTYALADYELSGADAKKAKTVKVAVISQNDDAEAIADAIAAGEYEAADLEDVLKDERIQIEIPKGLTGKLQIILVIINKDEDDTADVVKNVVAAKFEYYGSANPWESIGIGYIVDDLILPTYGYDPEAYEVEIQEHSETPGLYRIVEGFGAVAADFGVEGDYKDIEVHAENPNGVYILEQTFGFDFGKGEMGILTPGGDYIAYFTSQGYSESVIINAFSEYFGKLADGVMTFPMIEEEGSDGEFQVYMIQGDDYLYRGRNGEFKIVLPSTSSDVKARAASLARATTFAKQLNRYNKTNATDKKNIRQKVQKAERQLLRSRSLR